MMIVMLPFISFSKTVISDRDLDEVTAEQGVSVNFDCMTVGSVTVAVQSFGDSDGCVSCGSYTSAGWMGANNINVSGNILSLSSNMIVDVGTSGTETRINVILPTITVGAANVSGTMKVSNDYSLAGGNVLGTVDMRGFSTRVASDRVQIFAH